MSPRYAFFLRVNSFHKIPTTLCMCQCMYMYCSKGRSFICSLRRFIITKGSIILFGFENLSGAVLWAFL